MVLGVKSKKELSPPLVDFLNGFFDTNALFVARSFSFVTVVEKKFVFIDSRLTNPLRKGFVDVVCWTSLTIFCNPFSGGLIKGIWQVDGADICFLGTGRGVDLRGADMEFGSRLSCLLTLCLFLTLIARGSGAGRRGCGGMDSSVVHGGVASAVWPYISSPSWAFLSTESKRLKLPVLPRKMSSDPEWTCRV